MKGFLRSTERLALVHTPLSPEAFLAANGALVDRAAVAPQAFDGWSEIRAAILDLKAALPADGVVVIGETWAERDWSEAGRLAGFISAAKYFDGQAACV